MNRDRERRPRARFTAVSTSFALRLVLLVGALLAACGDGTSPNANNEAVGKTSAKLGGACTSVTGTVVSDHPIQANWWTSAVGSNVTFTPSASGCSPVEYQYRIQRPGQAYAVLLDYSGASSYVWHTAGETQGTYNFQVYARAVGSQAPYEAYWSFPFTLVEKSTCSSVVTTTSPIAYLAERYTMAAAGTPITFSSTAAGCTGARFRIAYKGPDNNQVEAASWSETDSHSTYVWDTTGKAPGFYTFTILARANSGVEYEWHTSVSFLLQSTPLCSAMTTAYAPYHPNSANTWMGSVGTTVTLTNTSSPCAATDSEYRIYHLPPNATTWTMVRDYPNPSTSDDVARNASFQWNTSGETPGYHQWQVWARGRGHVYVGYESYYQITYTLLPNAMCDGSPMTFTPSGHAAVGTPVHIRASATGCPIPSFRYTVLPPGGAWRAPQEWTTHPILHWNTLLERPGSYAFNIWDRNVDSTAYFESYSGNSYTLDPVTPTHSVSVTGGAQNNCVLLANGQVGCWGYNAHGELGSGTSANSSTPLPVAGLIQGISLGVGQAHACAVQYGGSVVCWGQNDQNQLGNGASAFATKPMPVSGLVSTAATIGVGAYHSCAALVDGTVQCWGSNSSGQLGDGTSGNTRAAPVTVAALPNDVTTGGAIQVVGGAAHTCALLGDGTVRCWGLNDRGQLGNGGSSNATSPVVVSALGGVTSLSARGNATCAVKSDGTIWCWGDPGSYGVLGNNTFAPNYQRTPVQVANVSTARNVAVGTDHACASLQNNTAVCWGKNDQGQLGNGTTTSSVAPVAVLSAPSGSALPNVASVGVSNNSSCALVDGHVTKCWGNGVNGELGNGANANSSTPVQVAPVPPWTACTSLVTTADPASTAASVGASITFTSVASGCATAEYEVYRQLPDQSWRRESSAYSTSNSSFVWNSGQPGVTGGVQKFRVVARAPGATQAYQAEYLFDYFLQSPDACNGLTVTASPASFSGTAGSLVTFTNTSTGCLGTPEYSIRHLRPDGTWHNDVAYSSANSTWVWDTTFDVAGWNQFEVTVRSQTSTLPQEEVRYVDYYLQPGAPRVGGGFWHFCQLGGTGQVGCWGLNSHGELGSGSTAFHSATPVAVQGITYGVSLGVGYEHACATILGGGVQCWGQNQWNQLGNNSQTDSPIPVNVAGVTNALHVAAGTAHSCAALIDGTVKCWGLNSAGQLGNGAPNSFSAPVTVAGLTNAKRVAAGYYHSCALLNDGTVRCWGLNDKGQLGNGTTTQSLAPVQVSGLTNVTQLSTYAYQNCAVKTDHTVWCWGANSPSGTLGDGTTTQHSAPVQVAGINNAVQVAVTGYHACAALQDGTAKCWGLNEHGELGNGTNNSSLSAVPVSGLTTVANIAVSEHASCAGLTSGGVTCWGWGLEGNLGNGSYGDSNTPTGVGNVPPAGGGGTTACTNGVQDGNETDIDCGGSCSPCQRGGGCAADADCASGFVCGTGNGGCFNGPRAKRVCWAATCADGVSPGECGQADSPCGPNCACATACDADTASLCAVGEVCTRDAGKLFEASSRDVCLDARCPSNDPSLCGGPLSTCGPCLCAPNCEQATCANPSDGCGGECAGVCAAGQSGCTSDLQCGSGNACVLNQDGSRTCRPAKCATERLVPPLCGTATAECGAVCPVCTPECDGRQCGPDPRCGTSCGDCSNGDSCNTDGQCVAPTTNPPPTVPGQNEGDPPIPVTPLPQVAASAVGAVKGAFNVSELGTPEYTIPIDVPPGRAGMEPALSLKYSGSRANGDLGIGWSLEGLSKITRCPKTFAIDGYAAPIKNDVTDAFCIDGKRMVHVTPSLGPNEYRTVVDSFARIEGVQDDTNDGIQLAGFSFIQKVERALQGPDYFRVYTKDGRILTYGGTYESLVMAPNGLRNTWLLRRVEDRAGNTMTISYDNQAQLMFTDNGLGLVQPRLITYTGSGSDPGNRQIRFNYETRADREIKYFQGGIGTLLQTRLGSIATWVNGKPVKSYWLHYQDGAAQSQVDRIYECEGATQARCKAPTTFEYKTETGFTMGASDVGVQSAVQLDLDGNGIPDFFETVVNVNGIPAHPEYKAAEIGADITVGLIAGSMSFGTGLAIQAGYSIVKMVALGLLADSPKIKYTRNIYMGTGNRLDLTREIQNVQGLPCSPGTPLTFLDYDRDGKDDVAGFCNNRLYVARSLGNGTFERIPNNTDPVLTVPKFSSIHGPLFDDWVAPVPVMYDVDGDSLHDLVYCTSEDQLEVRLRDGQTGGFLAAPVVLHGSSLPFCSFTHPTYMLFDVDGDGAIDLVTRGSTAWQVLRFNRSLSSGTSTLSWKPIEFKDWEKSDRGRGLMLGDLNGDGLTDVWSSDLGTERQQLGNNTVVWLNGGGGRFSQKQLPRPYMGGAGYQRHRAALIDYDGNGVLDILDNYAMDLEPDLATDRLVFATWVDTPKNDFSGYLTPKDASDLEYLASDGILRPSPLTLVTDIDGDGNADIYGDRAAVFFGSGLHNKMLSRVVDGLGNYVSVAYDDQGSHMDWYVNDCSTKTWPDMCLKKMSGLVTRHTEGVLQGESEVLERSYQYSYRNARMDVTGHGWLGFDSRSVDVKFADASDTARGAAKKITTEYWPPERTDLKGASTPEADAAKPPYLYPMAGLVRSVTVDETARTGSEEIPLDKSPRGYRRRTRVENEWKAQESGEHMAMPWLSSRATTVFERELPELVIGTPPPDEDGTVLYTCAETFDVEGYGNVREHDTDCRDGNARFLTADRVHTEIFPNSGAWLISNPQSITHYSDRDIFDYTRKVSFDYDDNGLLESVTRGSTDEPTSWKKVTYIRNPYGNVADIFEEVMTGEPSRNTHIEYDADQVFPATITNQLGHVTKLAYDERWGAVVTAIDPNNIVSSSSYDGLGLLHQTTDPSGTTTYTYTSTAVADQVVATTAGTIRPRFRVGRSKVAGALHEASVTTDVDYRGRAVRSVTDGIGGASIVQEQAYDPTGRLAAATLPHTLPAGSIPKVEYSYDGFNRLTQMTRPNGSVVRHEYASTITLRDERRNWLTGLDCQTAIVDEGVHGCAAGVEYTIDEAGRNGPIENVIVSDYLGLPIRNVDGENIDSLAQVTNYSYGGFNLLQAIYGSVYSHSVYDDYGRRIRRHGDNWEVLEESKYNGYDELKRTENANHQIRLYEYDGLGRLDTIWDSGEVRTKWTYDLGQNGIGRLASSASGITSQDPIGRRIEYAYEPYAGSANRGALQSINYIIDGVTYPTTLTYDALARPDEITYPNIGTATPPTSPPIVVQHKYDAASGALTGLDEVGASATRELWRVNEAYEGMLLQKETFENGAISTYAYDPQTRFLTYLKTTLPTLPAPGIPSVVNTVQHLVYEPYADGSVHTRTNRRDPAQVIKNEYVYDALNRLASAKVSVNGGTPTTKSYSYDLHGNLTDHDGVTNSYNQDTRYAYRLTSVGANTYQYDDNGNVSYRAGPDVPGGEQTIEYTAFDLPHTITSGTVDTYIEYTADEQRVALRGPDSTRYFIGGLYERAVDATTTTTTEERFRLYAGGRNLGEIVRRPGQPDQTLFFHTDHLESVDTISTNLHEVSHQDFEPFGANPGNALTRAGFTGHANDTDLGLIDMGGRIYDPLAGRFMTEDPVMQAPHWSQGLNPYSYVFNDPINHTDPSGFSADVDVGGGIVGGIVGAGHLAAPALMAAGLGANLETAAIGGVAGGINIGVSALLGFPGAGSAPKTFTTPGGTHAPGAVGGAGSNALAQHSEIPQGSAKVQERPPGTSLFDAGAVAGPGGCGYCEAQREARKRIGRWFEDQWDRSELKNIDVERAKKAALVVANGVRSAWDWIKVHASDAAEPTPDAGVQPDKRFTPDQQAVIELAKEGARHGLTPEEAEALMDLAKGTGLPVRDDIGTTHWVGGDHIHVGPINHIPVRP